MPLSDSSLPVVAGGNPVLPLQGVTLLVVEDSRHSAEAMRLMALRLGARLRRASTLAMAQRHLATYRPTLILVDMGLPDGSGADLIAWLARGPAAPPVVALSGDPGLAAAALDAGAAEFVAKPLPDPEGFYRLICRHLPDRPAVRPAGWAASRPDSLALRDDLVQAAELLGCGPDAVQQAYLARFLAGIARSTDDRPLEEAATGLRGSDPGRLMQLAGLLADRIRTMPQPFAQPG